MKKLIFTPKKKKTLVFTKKSFVLPKKKPSVPFKKAPYTA